MVAPPSNGRRKPFRILMPLALALVGATIGGYLWLRSRRTPPTPFETAAVDRGPIVAKVTATGTLSALVTVQVGSQVSGRVQQLFVDYNSIVKKGDLIARLDPEYFNAALAQAKANQMASQAAVAKDRVLVADGERTYKRLQSLRAQNLVAQSDADTAETTYLAAKAQLQADEATVAQSKASLAQAEVNLAYTKIYAPISGMVIQRNVDVGQTVAASFQAPVLFTIAEDLTHIQVDTNIAEADVGKLTDGMTATFTVDAYANESFQGKIRQIRNASQTLQNVVTYDAVIDVENKELKLRPGMTANVTVIYAERGDVVRVPNAALRFRLPPGLAGAKDHHAEAGTAGALPKKPGQRTVYVAKADQPDAVTVRVGVTDGTTSELLDGPLQPGNLLITGLTSAGQSAMAQRMRSPF
jgi:HlyD family secretion protein